MLCRPRAPPGAAAWIWMSAHRHINIRSERGCAPSCAVGSCTCICGCQRALRSQQRPWHGGGTQGAVRVGVTSTGGFRAGDLRARLKVTMSKFEASFVCENLCIGLLPNKTSRSQLLAPPLLLHSNSATATPFTSEDFTFSRTLDLLVLFLR